MKVIIAVICSLLFIGGCGDDPQTYWIHSTGQDSVEVGTDSDETRDTGSIEDYETYEGYLDSETLWESESESQTEAQTDWDSQTETESESQTEAQTDWDSQTESESESQTEAQTDWDSENGSFSDGSTDSEEEPKEDECDSTAECQAIYGPTATDCVNSKSDNSFCRCGAAPCRVTTGAK